MRLSYCGPDIPAGSAIPLPEGWPAADHDEPDAAVAEAKVASGNYRNEESAFAPRSFRTRGKQTPAPEEPEEEPVATTEEELTDGD